MPFIGLSKPKEQTLAPLAKVGDAMPSVTYLTPHVFNLVLFLRHTGCPFAEAAVKQAVQLAANDARVGLTVVTHGERVIAEGWLEHIGAQGITHYHDADREEYGRWGVGFGGAGSLLHPMVAWHWARFLWRGIRNRSASGTRWQTQAMFLLNSEGVIVWRHIA
ncbi:MAG: hypothetical protein R3183_12330, partial [Oleiphilaceae bacterium]|nr:hypothetical protein [Oleiphilaceae bacterium]